MLNLYETSCLIDYIEKRKSQYDQCILDSTTLIIQTESDNSIYNLWNLLMNPVIEDKKEEASHGTALI